MPQARFQSWLHVGGLPVLCECWNAEDSGLAVHSFISTAPSAPQHVTARLVRTPVVEVKWKEPAFPNGIIVNYTIYASASLTFSGYIQSPQTDMAPATIVASKVGPMYVL
jgi:hypothetical protein